MDNLKNNLKNNFQNLGSTIKTNQVILGILFSIYLIMGYRVPQNVASVIDTIYGKAVVILCALLLFSKSHPILGILGFFVAYQILTQSSVATGSNGLSRYAPTEEKKYTSLTEYNQFPYTLEQEVVKKMAPSSNFKTTSDTKSYTFNPVLEDSYNAASIMEKGTLL